MSYVYNKNNKENAKKLRKRMTPEERHLWYDFLKELPYTVNRQKMIGNYIVDFFIAEKRIAIELDGSQHTLEVNKEADNERDKDLYRLGITVLRISNSLLNERFNYVCDKIMKYLE